MCGTNDTGKELALSEQDGGFVVSSDDIHNYLPRYFENCKKDSLPDDLYGSELLKFGSCMGGLLGIEYKTKEGIVRRIVFDYSEEGVWIKEQSF